MVSEESDQEDVLTDGMIKVSEPCDVLPSNRICEAYKMAATHLSMSDHLL